MKSFVFQALEVTQVSVLMVKDQLLSSNFTSHIYQDERMNAIDVRGQRSRSQRINKEIICRHERNLTVKCTKYTCISIKLSTGVAYDERLNSIDF